MMDGYLDPKNKQWWDRLGRKDPYYFTYPDAPISEYYSVGEAAVAELLERFYAYGAYHDALEIGSGMGRLTVPLARRFDRVTAIDVSEVYLGYLRDRCASEGITNVESGLVSMPWDRPERYDLVLSIYALQHVTSWTVIERYIEAASRVLRPGGTAILQFDSRPPTLGYRLRRHLPGVIAPRKLKPGYRRVRRSPEALRQHFSASGLEIIHNEGRNTTFDLYVLQRASADETLAVLHRGGA